MSEYSEGKYEALYFGYMKMHRQSRELAHQKMQEMNDELSNKDEEIERLRELLTRCVPWMLMLEDTWSAEAEFRKLIDEVKGYE
jgi:hypothetical protein